MSVAEVSQLPLREKLQIMEAIWQELRQKADSAGIPQDQKDLLDARRARVASGEARILDWDSVKHSIGRA
jgi:putative addiction module component (TIGR02574 family)